MRSTSGEVERGNIRPSELHDESHKQKENPYRPTSLDDLIIACGGKNVDYEEKNKCFTRSTSPEVECIYIPQ